MPVNESVDVIIELDTGSVKRSFSTIEKNSKKSGKKIGKNLSVGLGGLKKQILGVGAALATAFAGRKLITAAIEQENAVNELNTALKLSGKFSEEASQDLQDYASSLQQVSTVGDETTLKTAALIQSLGQLSVDGLKRATTAATDLSAALGVDLNAAALLVGKAAAGEISSFSRYGLIIKKGADNAETLSNALTALEGKFGGAAAAKLNTFSGATQAMANAFGDVLEELGFAITKSPIIIKLFNDIKESLVIFAEQLKGFSLEQFVDRGIKSITSFKNTFVASIASSGVALAIFNAQILTLKLGSALETGAIAILLIKDKLIALNAVLRSTILTMGFLKTALIATGIGAAVVVVGLLVKRFLDLRDAGLSVGDAFSNTFSSVFKQIQILFLEFQNFLIEKSSFLGEKIFKAVGITAEKNKKIIDRLKGELATVGIGESGKTVGKEIADKIAIPPTAKEILIGELIALREAVKAQLTSGDLFLDENGMSLLTGPLVTQSIKELEFLKAEINKSVTDSKKKSEALSKTFKSTLSSGISSGVQNMVKALAKGEDGFKAFGNAIGGIIGDLSIMMGNFFIAEGIAALSLKGLDPTGTIAAGVGLVALGTLIKGVFGGSSSSASAGAEAGSGVADTVQDEIVTDGLEEGAGKTTGVTINVEGTVIDAKTTGENIAEALQEFFDASGGQLVVNT